MILRSSGILLRNLLYLLTNSSHNLILTAFPYVPCQCSLFSCHTKLMNINIWPLSPSIKYLLYYSSKSPYTFQGQHQVVDHPRMWQHQRNHSVDTLKWSKYKEFNSTSVYQLTAIFNNNRHRYASVVGCKPDIFYQTPILGFHVTSS